MILNTTWMKILSGNKSVKFYIRLLVAMVVLLLMITVGQSYLEYRSSRAAILNLFRNQAEILITSVAKAGEKGLIAYQSLQEEVISKLFMIARMIDSRRIDNSAGIVELAKIASENKISEIAIFNNKAKLLVSYSSIAADGRAKTEFVNTNIIPFIDNANEQAIPGFINGMFTEDKVFAIILKSRDNGIIYIGIDPSDLQNQRRAFATGSIIEDLSQSNGIRYAGITNDDMIIVATRNFPVDQYDSWYGDRQEQNDSIYTRIKKLQLEQDVSFDIFEARGPFYVADLYYGDIVIGMDTQVLELLNTKLQRDVFWHSILGLLTTLVAVFGLFLWNNYRLISGRYDEIKKEVQKLEADKATKARRASMGELAAGVAHEIRNPLNAIRVIVQRLEREFEPVSERDEYLDMTRVVKRETDRINDSIEQFLKMARPPALNKSPGNINDCLEGVLELFKPRADQRNIEIVKELQPVPDINIDSKLCSQAILNILENALDAVNRDGRIIIRTFVKGKKIFIEIVDSGPGITDDLKSRIFDMYFTTKDSGTGMGLPSVLMTVKEHGGSVEVLDNPTGGAIFKLEFPVE